MRIMIAVLSPLPPGSRPEPNRCDAHAILGVVPGRAAGASIPVYLEVGAKRVFACAYDWPGWCRVGKDEASALEALAAYARRYAAVAKEARVPFAVRGHDNLTVIERIPGSATTDFGAPAEIASRDTEFLTRKEAERITGLVAAAWVVFDGVVSQAPAELRKGPRGGGRARDPIAAHVLDAEAAYASKLNLRLRAPAYTDRRGVQAFRDEIASVLRAPSDGKPLRERGWPARYAARRIAWHVLDHAWEIEDRSEPIKA